MAGYQGWKLVAAGIGVLLGAAEVRAQSLTVVNDPVWSDFWLFKVTGLSGDGKVIVGYGQDSTKSGRPFQAFAWSQTQGLRRFGDNTFRASVNLDGSAIVVESLPPTQPASADLWRGDQRTTIISESENTFRAAPAVSDDGKVVVGWGAQVDGKKGFVWKETTGVTWLNPSTIGTLRLLDVSSDGKTAAGTQGSAVRDSDFLGDPQNQPVIWTETGGLQVLPGPNGTRAELISGDGQFIAGTSGDLSLVAWRNGGQMITLADGSVLAGADAITPRAISKDGSLIVGTTLRLQGGPSLWMWDAAHGLRDFAAALTLDYGIDLHGFTFTDVAGISDDGKTITGSGYQPGDFDPSGPWIVQLPEPAPLAASSTVGLLLRRRRTHQRTG